MKWSLDDALIFLAVAETQSITRAAERLNKPKSTVSNALARLENALGLRLVERTTRALRLTPEGETFRNQCTSILEHALEANATMTGLTASPRGRLAVALPSAFCQEILAPRLGEFIARYPDIELDLTVRSQSVDLFAEHFDMAVVVGEQADSQLTRRVLLGGHLVWIASPGYLVSHGLTAEQSLTPSQLGPHLKICEKRYSQPNLAVRYNGQAAQIPLGANAVRLNSPLALREAVVAGAGISFLPARLCKKHLAAGNLVQLCRHIDFDIAAATLSVVYPTRRLLSARGRAFLDFLSEICTPLTNGNDNKR